MEQTAPKKPAPLQITQGQNEDAVDVDRDGDVDVDVRSDEEEDFDLVEPGFGDENTGPSRDEHGFPVGLRWGAEVVRTRTPEPEDSKMVTFLREALRKMGLRVDKADARADWADAHSTKLLAEMAGLRRMIEEMAQAAEDERAGRGSGARGGTASGGANRGSRQPRWSIGRSAGIHVGCRLRGWKCC